MVDKFGKYVDKDSVRLASNRISGTHLEEKLKKDFFLQTRNIKIANK